MQTNMTVEEIANLFYVADQDHSGRLSFDEIGDMMTTIKGGVRPPPAEIERCLRAMDTNGDGVISEQEFLQAMLSWLGIVNSKKRSHDSGPGGSPTFNRKKTVTDITNFFKQFSPIPDFQEEQRRILSQGNRGMSLLAIHREYQNFTVEEKAAKYELIKRILADGRDVLLHDINSFDWSIVISGLSKVQVILSIVEIFPTAEERFDFAPTIFQIFDGVTQSDTSSTTGCIIRRVCSLLNPDVPVALQPQVYIPCLKALRDYITGPGITSLDSVASDESIWNPLNGFTKQMVELENLPIRLIKILEICSASFPLTAEFQMVLCECLKCLIVYTEDHSGCLEGMLQLGLRNKIIHLLQADNLHDNEIIKYSLHLLCILCGYTHSFDLDEDDSAPVSSIPLIVGINEQMLYEILLILNKSLTGMSTAIAQSTAVVFDEIVVINIGILCQYLLPLCRPNDPMYQNILHHLITLYKYQWNIESPISQALYLTFNHCFDSIMRSSAEICHIIWTNTPLHPILFQQLQYISSMDAVQRTTTTTDANSLINQLFSSCLGLYDSLLDLRLFDLLIDKRNYNFMKICLLLLSSVEYNAYLSEFLLNCLSYPELLSDYLALGILDGIFNLFIKFKQNSNLLSDVLGVFVGPVYTITLLANITSSLLAMLTSHPIQSQYTVTLASAITSNHLEMISQVYGIICSELKKGSLRFSPDLGSLTDSLLLLLDTVLKVYSFNRLPQSEYLQNEFNPLLTRWNEDLSISLSEGQVLIKKSGEMEIVSGKDQKQLHSLIKNRTAAQNDLLITGVPTWVSGTNQPQTVTVPFDITIETLRNGFCALYQTDLTLAYESELFDENRNQIGKKFTPLILRREFEQHIERTLSLQSVTTNPTTTIPIIIHLQKNTSSSFSSIVSSAVDEKDYTLKSLKKTCELMGLKADMKLMNYFYEYFSQNTSENSNYEINQQQFIEILININQGYNEQTARDIFDAFDDDGNGRLSYNEICIGLSKLLNGNLDDKLEMIFYSYDKDRNHKLDLEELINMIMISNGVSYDQARTVAIRAGNKFDQNQDNVLDLQEFKLAYYNGNIPLGFTWSNSSAKSNPNRFQSKGNHNQNFQPLQTKGAWNNTRSSFNPNSGKGHVHTKQSSPSPSGFMQEKKPFNFQPKSLSAAPNLNALLQQSKQHANKGMFQPQQQQQQQQSNQRQNIRRAFSASGPEKGGGGGGDQSALPVPKLRRGKAQDDSTIG